MSAASRVQVAPDCDTTIAPLSPSVTPRLLIGCQVLSPLKYVDASVVPVADNSVVPIVLESIFQVPPEFDTVISPLSPSVTAEPVASVSFTQLLPLYFNT